MHKFRLGQRVRIPRRGGVLDPSHDPRIVYEIVKLVPADASGALDTLGYRVKAGAIERAVREDDIEDADADAGPAGP